MANDFSTSPRRVVIYALSDPRKPSLIRYIGKTCNPLRLRRARHLVEMKQNPSFPKNRWLNLLTSVGIRPHIWPIEICSENNWEERERYWVSFFWRLPGLLNCTRGGDRGPDMTGYRHTEEARRKIAWSNMGRKGWKPSLEQRKKMSERLRGKYPSHFANYKRQIQPKQLGLRFPRRHTEAWKRKMSATTTGRKFSKERIEKTRMAILASPKWWAARRSKRGIKRPPEYFLKFAEARKTSRKWIDTHYKPVICVTTGEKFDSISKAAASVGSKIYGLSRALRCKRNFHGMEWRYA